MPGQPSETDYKGYRIRVYQEETFRSAALPTWRCNIYRQGEILSVHDSGIAHSAAVAIAAARKWIDEHPITEG